MNLRPCTIYHSGTEGCEPNPLSQKMERRFVETRFQGVLTVLAFGCMTRAPFVQTHPGSNACHAYVSNRRLLASRDLRGF